MHSFDRILPTYTVYYYTDFLYRVVKFKRRDQGVSLHDPDQEPQERFLQSYSRSRSKVLQYSLCNQWDYFLTITVDPKRFDRWELDSIYAALYDFFRVYRLHFSRLDYLLVPEHHKDGAWHFHGLIRGILPSHLHPFVAGVHPQKLVDAGYLNFPLLADVIGYVSLAQLRDPVAAGFYITKYITKEHAHDDFYQHLYYHSQGLKTARPVADCYIYSKPLEDCLTFESDFVSCGWAKLKTPDFTFPLALPGCEPRDLEELQSVDEAVLQSLDSKYHFVQLIQPVKTTPPPVPDCSAQSAGLDSREFSPLKGNVPQKSCPFITEIFQALRDTDTRPGEKTPPGRVITLC